MPPSAAAAAMTPPPMTRQLMPPSDTLPIDAAERCQLRCRRR